MVAKQILLAEDDAFVRDMIKTVLSSEGYQIDEAKNGLQAVAWMHEKAYDLILSDIQMPQMGGMGVLEEARRLQPKTRVILMSGQDADPDQLRELGAFDFIEKPFPLDILLEIIERSFRPLQPQMHEPIHIE